MHGARPRVTSATSTSRSTVPPSEDLAAGRLEGAVGRASSRCSPGYTAAHRTTLIFTNTRRLAERLAHRLGERIGAEQRRRAPRQPRRASAGSSVEARLKARRAARAGRDRVARARHRHRRRSSSSCQIGSPRSIATRAAARSGARATRSALRAEGPPVPDLARRAGRVRGAAARGARRPARPDRAARGAARHPRAADRRRVRVRRRGARTRCFARVRGRWPYRELARADFEAVLAMLADGFDTPKGRRARVPAPRPGERPAARAARRAPGGAHARAARSRRSATTRSCSTPTTPRSAR